MKTATIANVRTTVAANQSGATKALKIAFAGGSVMGLTVAAMGLLGLGFLFWMFDDDEYLPEIMEGVDTQMGLILMDHQPKHLKDAREAKIDIQLSGHTHNGQLFPLNFIVKRIFELAVGYKKIGHTHYFVSPGLGTWGPPVRTNARPEILVLDIHFQV